jgi:Protein of unknown function (DUF1393).
MSQIKKIVITALSVALGIVLPMAFHAVPRAGMLYLPMHFPVLLGGLVTGPVYGIVIGLLAPLFSSLLTGMPPASSLPMMMIELAFYGFFSGLFMLLLKKLPVAGRVYASLLSAMILGRVLAGIIRALFFTSGSSYSFSIWFSSYFVTGIVGIVAQIILLPLLYFALVKAKLIEAE